MKITQSLKDIIRSRLALRHTEKELALLKTLEARYNSEIKEYQKLLKAQSEMYEKYKKIIDVTDEFKKSFGKRNKGVYLNDGRNNNKFIYVDNYSDEGQAIKKVLFNVDEEYLLILEDIELSSDKEGVLKRILDKISKL